MTNLAAVLKDEIRRLARKEVRAELSATKKAVTAHRKDLAALKRENAALKRQIASLGRASKRGAAPAATETAHPGIPEGSRFSKRSLKAQRRRTGLSQADYAWLVGVSTLTLSNWELGKNRPRDHHFAKLISLRGLGKREAEKMLEEMSGE